MAAAVPLARGAAFTRGLRRNCPRRWRQRRRHRRHRRHRHRRKHRPRPWRWRGSRRSSASVHSRRPRRSRRPHRSPPRSGAPVSLRHTLRGGLLAKARGLRGPAATAKTAAQAAQAAQAAHLSASPPSARRGGQQAGRPRHDVVRLPTAPPLARPPAAAAAPRRQPALLLRARARLVGLGAAACRIPLRASPLSTPRWPTSAPQRLRRPGSSPPPEAQTQTRRTAWREMPPGCRGADETDKVCGIT